MLVHDCGVRHGERVAIAMRNYPEWVVSYWAVASIGAAVVGMNAWWTSQEMAYGLGDVVQQRRMIDQSPGERSYKMRLGQHLDAMLALCETVGCRRQNLLGYFGEASGPCGNCDPELAQAEQPEPSCNVTASSELLSCPERRASCSSSAACAMPWKP